MIEPLTAHLRLRLSQADAHYGGNLVAGAKLMELFGDVATELCIRRDGDEGLFAGYSSVEFVAPAYAGDFIEVRGTITRVGNTSRQMDFEVVAPAYAGDFIEVRGTITRVGNTSRQMDFEVVRYALARPDISDSAADLLDEPELIARAVGTCVVPRDRQRMT